jgi:hypothetical protein
MTLTQVERNYFVRKAGGATPTERLTSVKRRYIAGFLGGGTNAQTSLAQMEKLWLMKVLADATITVTDKNSIEELWRLSVVSISKSPSKFLNDNKITFYVNAS